MTPDNQKNNEHSSKMLILSHDKITVFFFFICPFSVSPSQQANLLCILFVFCFLF